jgi:hypothetical protein
MLIFNIDFTLPCLSGLNKIKPAAGGQPHKKFIKKLKIKER